MVADWYGEGYDSGDIELWASGMSSSGLDTFINNETSATFAGYDPWMAFYPSKDDLFIINRQGQVAHEVNLGDMSLSNSANRQQIEQWVELLLQ